MHMDMHMEMHMHDLHATMRHRFRIDHERLTQRFQGRDFRCGVTPMTSVAEIFQMTYAPCPREPGLFVVLMKYRQTAAKAHHLKSKRPSLSPSTIHSSSHGTNRPVPPDGRGERFQ